jgi:hypothetical protein
VKKCQIIENIVWRWKRVSCGGIFIGISVLTNFDVSIARGVVRSMKWIIKICICTYWITIKKFCPKSLRSRQRISMGMEIWRIFNADIWRISGLIGWRWMDIRSGRFLGRFLGGIRKIVWGLGSIWRGELLPLRTPSLRWGIFYRNCHCRCK